MGKPHRRRVKTIYMDFYVQQSQVRLGEVGKREARTTVDVHTISNHLCLVHFVYLFLLFTQCTFGEAPKNAIKLPME